MSEPATLPILPQIRNDADSDLSAENLRATYLHMVEAEGGLVAAKDAASAARRACYRSVLRFMADDGGREHGLAAKVAKVLDLKQDSAERLVRAALFADRAGLLAVERWNAVAAELGLEDGIAWKVGDQASGQVIGDTEHGLFDSRPMPDTCVMSAAWAAMKKSRKSRRRPKGAGRQVQDERGRPSKDDDASTTKATNERNDGDAGEALARRWIRQARANRMDTVAEVGRCLRGEHNFHLSLSCDDVPEEVRRHCALHVLREYARFSPDARQALGMAMRDPGTFAITAGGRLSLGGVVEDAGPAPNMVSSPAALGAALREVATPRKTRRGYHVTLQPDPAGLLVHRPESRGPRGKGSHEAKSFYIRSMFPTIEMPHEPLAHVCRVLQRQGVGELELRWLGPTAPRGALLRASIRLNGAQLQHVDLPIMSIPIIAGRDGIRIPVGGEALYESIMEECRRVASQGREGLAVVFMRNLDGDWVEYPNDLKSRE